MRSAWTRCASAPCTWRYASAIRRSSPATDRARHVRRQNVVVGATRRARRQRPDRARGAGAHGARGLAVPAERNARRDDARVRAQHDLRRRRQRRRRRRAAERSDESHVFLADRSRGARPDAGGRDRSVRRFDYRRRLDDTRYAPSVAGAARREAASEPRNEPLGRDQCRDLGQPRAARRHRQERARPFRSRRARARRREVARAVRRHQRHHLLGAARRARRRSARRPTSSSKRSSSSSTARTRAASRSWAAR